MFKYSFHFFRLIIWLLLVFLKNDVKNLWIFGGELDEAISSMPSQIYVQEFNTENNTFSSRERYENEIAPSNVVVKEELATKNR